MGLGGGGRKGRGSIAIAACGGGGMVSPLGPGGGGAPPPWDPGTPLVELGEPAAGWLDLINFKDSEPFQILSLLFD